MLDAPLWASVKELWQSAVIPLTIFAGTLAVQLLYLTKGIEGTVRRLRELWPNKTDVFYTRVDFILMSVIGTVVAKVFFEPGDPKAAFMAGVGFASAINAMATGPKDAHTRPAAAGNVQPGGD